MGHLSLENTPVIFYTYEVRKGQQKATLTTSGTVTYLSTSDASGFTYIDTLSLSLVYDAKCGGRKQV